MEITLEQLIEHELGRVIDHDNPDIEVYAQYDPNGEFTQLSVCSVHTVTHQQSSKSVYGLQWLKDQYEYTKVE